MTRNLIVDGTRDVIADGRVTTLHVIANKTDYTHQRIVGYAVTLEDAALFAAAEDMKFALSEVVTAWAEGDNIVGAIGNANAALSKSETP